MEKEICVSVKEAVEAKRIISQQLSPTSLTHYQGLSDLLGVKAYIKHENQQPGGSFKIRGGLNLMHHLKKAEVPGVITFSTGNHGISVGMSANYYQIPAIVVVPKGNSIEKNQLIIETGAKLVEAGNNFEEAAEYGLQLQKEKGYRFIHAANEPHLINGVATGFLEIIEALPNIDAIILPIGGGSELAAAVTVFKELKPQVAIIAVQAKESPAAYLSWQSKKIRQADNHTFAGGFATGAGCQLPLSIYQDHLTDFVLLSEKEILEGIGLAYKYTKNVAEGAGSASIMACLKLKEQLAGKTVVMQMSGANELLAVYRKGLATLS
ncbi:pyridoxal-phosphate dependent enzyme [uncultured Vagococcus sp.]|uniref:threonine ammonia-lyase n=1 Tax=uncultured Vagococcus sp. TaxID=189676 RepID=UPI0028D39954|nr:pyridoxal-phosphate dependent enzyme [uncultured Vagococcus sp.]